jgi:hypothetical protein
MFRRVTLLLLATALFCPVWAQLGLSALSVVFVERITRFVTWVDARETTDPEMAPLIGFCLSPQKDGVLLESIRRTFDQPFNQRALPRYCIITQPEELVPCHFYFFAPSQQAQLQTYLARIDLTRSVTISTIPRALEEGVQVYLKEDNQRIKLVFHPQILQENAFKFSAYFLSYGEMASLPRRTTP